MARVTRATYAEAFAAIAGRPLIQLPQVAGRSESEIFFDALALNAADLNADGEAERLLEPFSAELAAALRARGYATVAALAPAPDDSAEARRLGCSHVLCDGDALALPGVP